MAKTYAPQYICVAYLFCSVILPHGIVEFSAIAGGAEFVLARAIFAPGNLSNNAVSVD